jgi:hypothetical protein
VRRSVPVHSQLSRTNEAQRAHLSISSPTTSQHQASSAALMKLSAHICPFRHQSHHNTRPAQPH